MHRIFMMGSCVSRDAFECFDKSKFSLTGYVARSSIGSSFSGVAAKDVYSSKIVSAFQRNQVMGDFLKTLPLKLAEINFDTLLVDFIDERFPLFRFDDGCVVTISIELHQLGEIQKAEGRIIPEFTEEHFTYWLKGWKNFIEIAKNGGFLDKIIINKSYWTERTIDGSQLESVTSRKIKEANTYLDRLYKICSATIEPRQFLEYDLTLLVSDPSHKWKGAPFHYAAPFYEKTREFMINRVLASHCQSSSNPAAIRVLEK